MLFQRTHLLFRRTHLLFRRTQLLFRRTHLLFRRTQLLFRRTHLLFRRTQLLFRRTHLLFQRVHNAPHGGNKHTIPNGVKAENISLLNASCFSLGASLSLWEKGRRARDKSAPPNALAPFDFRTAVLETREERFSGD
ncbi:MAG: hypothetical protein RMY34_23625 [Aulosira sp. DedQUE10]|nr:hypothetical protein [Aulosira sp. DedQUE10]